MGGLRFRGRWRLDAEPALVFAALADVERYPQWWPAVVSTRRIDDASGELTLRPGTRVEVNFVAAQRLVDHDDLVLEAEFTGGISGSGRWSVSATPAGAVAEYDETMTFHIPVLKATGLLARPLVRASHDAMMRAGEKGLRRYLAVADTDRG